MNNGWIGVDLDGTLAEYKGWIAADHIGPPIPKMVERIKKWVAEGQEVRIFTARVSPVSARYNGIDVDECYMIIRQWVIDVFGYPLQITHEKDFAMIAIYDDMDVYQIKQNTGEIINRRIGENP